MISLIYTVVSIIAYAIFSVVFTITSGQIQQELSKQIVSNQNIPEENTQDNSSLHPEKTPEIFIADQTTASDVNTDLTEPQFGGANYVVEPGDKEGMYTMKNVPIEPMSTVDELNQAVNVFRAVHGQGALDINDHLCEFAAFRAKEIEGDFSHDGFSRYIDEGKTKDYSFTHYGENIWTGSMMGVHIVEYGWAKSPGHYAALVGQWTNGCGGIYGTNAVFIFAR